MDTRIVHRLHLVIINGTWKHAIKVLADRLIGHPIVHQRATANPSATPDLDAVGINALYNAGIDVDGNFLKGYTSPTAAELNTPKTSTVPTARRLPVDTTTRRMA